MGCTDPNFMLCSPSADRNRPTASGSARTPSRHPRSRTPSAATAWLRTPGSFVAPYERTESRRSAAVAGFRLTRWLYVLCWTGDDRPGLLFDRATTWLLAHK